MERKRENPGLNKTNNDEFKEPIEKTDQSSPDNNDKSISQTKPKPSKKTKGKKGLFNKFKSNSVTQTMAIQPNDSRQDNNYICEH